MSLFLITFQQIAQAQSNSEMDLQRCVWGCLAQSKGNDDPAYHSCVSKFCVEASQPLSDEDRQQTSRTDRNTVLFVQQSLAELGFDPGPRDGAYGRRTATAIGEFQRSQGLQSSGRIDDALVSALQSARQSPQITPGSSGTKGASLDVPVIEYGGDGQAANCASSVVSGLKADGDGFLAVRSGPGSEYRKIDELDNGSVVYVFDQKGEWVGVVYNVSSIDCTSSKTAPVQHQFKGWVHGKWLKNLAG